MMRLLVLIMATASFLNALMGQGKVEPIRLDSPISIDGNPIDWPANAWTWDNREPIRFAVGYDEEYLYLAWTAEDARWQNQILMTGLTVRIDPDKKSSNRLSLGYPVGVQPALRPTDPNQLARYLFQLQRNRESLLATMIGLDRSVGKSEDTTWVENPAELGIQVATAWDERGLSMTIEYQIPWEQVPGDTPVEKMKLHWLTGNLGRPEQLRGGDAAGMNSNMGINSATGTSAEERQWYKRLDAYRNYAAPREMKVRRVVWP